MQSFSSKPKPYPIINQSGNPVIRPSGLPMLRDGRFRVLAAAVAGDAPKDFVRIYEYGKGYRSRPGSWPAWIAKVGHKYYPNESITEHLLTRIGQTLGLRVADSRLMWFGSQLRFLSRYFLRPKRESLVHGAEIFAGFLADRDFVEEVERNNEARNLFTFQFVEQALRDRFPGHADELLVDFTRLLAFDAIVGNNDRHFYNWGVIVDVDGRRPPRFSPIFDTARALYWNTREDRLQEVARDPKRRAANQERYVQRCFPKTGWDQRASPNHFELIAAICGDHLRLRTALQDLPLESLRSRVSEVLEGEFRRLISPLRADFILSCLDRRAILFSRAIQPGFQSSIS